MRGTERRGFILATTLLVMTVLTVMLAAAFVMISAEFRTTNGSFGSTRALNLAQAGIATYFAQSHNLTTGYDSTIYSFSKGYARVVARKLRDSTTTSKAVWVVYATGVDTTNSTNRGSTGAQRVIARLAKLDPGNLPARAAFVAANGVTMQGGGGNPISGQDFGFVTPNCNTAARHDTTGLTTNTTGYNNGAGALPTRGVEYLPTDNTVTDSTYIDWAKLIAGQFTPDYVNQLPPAGNATYYTYYWPDSTGTVNIPSGTYRGFLVTLGDVTLQANAHWDGIILAGGQLNAGGNVTYTVHGMVITGMNIARGHNVPPNPVRRGGSRVIRWDYCYATSSISSLGFLQPVISSTTDSWKTW